MFWELAKKFRGHKCPIIMSPAAQATSAGGRLEARQAVWDLLGVFTKLF